METCPYCNRSFSTITSRHKAVCDGWPKPDKPEPCLCGHESTSLTQMKRHRSKCGVWKSRDAEGVRQSRMRSTSIARYGVEHANQTDEVRARVAATNLERYGAINPFSRAASTFDKVQASLDGKRPVLKGADNPFAREDVKAKVRGHWMREHGVTNPQQVVEIRAKTTATCETRYGGVLLASPVLAEKARETNHARYGDEFPQRTDGVKAKQQGTNLARYGVPWTSMDPEVRAKQLEAHHAKWGSHYFASDDGKAHIRSVLVERFGVEFPGAIEGHWERAVQTFRERYGVEHPLQLAEFLDKSRQTSMKNWGAPHPMQNPEYARQHLEEMSPLRGGPNGLERKVMALAPEDTLLFTGDFSFWRWLPALGHHKNPDFIVPGPDAANPKKGVTRVVEAFGDYFHSKMFTGKVPFEHERELIDAYADVGLECLVIWESEIKNDLVEVRARVAAFVAATR